MKTSVALCTYNGEKFLKEQLDSILAQSIPINEIIICDDSSTDGTSHILQMYQNQYPHVFKIYFNDKNIGYVRNFEKALTLCNGDVIFLADQDDIWNENKIDETIKYLKKNPSKVIVAHNLALLDNKNINISFWSLKNFRSKEQNYNSRDLLQYLLVTGNVFPGMSLALKKEALQQFLPLKKLDSILIHDYELVIKAVNNDAFGMINKILGSYRKHENQSIGYSNKKNKNHNELTEIHLQSQHLKRLKNYISIFNLPPAIVDYVEKDLKEKYTTYLNKYSLLKRIYIHLKNKYYYKVITF